ncbi:MAG: single-stranded DNA-binding protein [Candidatus Edwardsbacteria bacterium]
MAGLKLPNINSVLLAGRLTRDPELRYTPAGSAVCTFPLAINRWYKDATGQRQEDVCYVNIVTWREIAENCSKNLHKSSAVLIEGKLENRRWETESGQKKSTVEIRAERVQFLDQTAPSIRAPSQKNLQTTEATEYTEK